MKLRKNQSDNRQEEFWLTFSSCSYVQVLHLHSGWLGCHPPPETEMVTNMQQCCHSSLYNLELIIRMLSFTSVMHCFIYCYFNRLFVICCLPRCPQGLCAVPDHFFSSKRKPLDASVSKSTKRMSWVFMKTYLKQQFVRFLTTLHWLRSFAHISL